jgi:hypothetical protein
MSDIIIKGEEVKVHPLFNLYGTTFSGKVYRLESKHRMAEVYNKKAKYMYVRVCQENVAKNRRLHIMIAQCWIPNPENKRVVNHKDGDKLNNHGSNLEWVTDSENQQHAISLGLKQSGQELYNSKLEDKEVHRVCELLEEGYRVKDLAEMFNVKKDNIRKIRDGSCYFHVRKLYVNIPHNFKTEYSVGTVRWVCSKIVEGISDINISKLCSNKNLTPIDVKRIRRKIRYTDISDEYFD